MWIHDYGDAASHQSIFVQGAVDRYDCIYVKPQTGRSNYKFDIMYNSCGSKPDLNGRFYENNIVVQYDQDLIEVIIKPECFHVSKLKF